MDIRINGIKCDAEGCDFKIEDDPWGATPELMKESAQKYLNMPCPKCGAPLLTQEDYDAVLSMVEIAPIISELEAELIAAGGDPTKVTVPVDMDGTGKLDFKL